ncbi:hypothetical protein AVEN_172295-1 [Araneus ventricosus]|uniref:Uncharacterized protein n=1 Tax=Araneus ventricosus TaxID=182803 RepID=A0A4Y2R414_ARAVE|nr:hypothetical protein AVEN_172295-1 [Araneus ventricosus]
MKDSRAGSPVKGGNSADPIVMEGSNTQRRPEIVLELFKYDAANLNCDNIIPISVVYFAKISEKKRQLCTFHRKKKARIAAENVKQEPILKKFIKIENIESREGLSTTVEGKSLTSENFENENITYCSNQEQEVPVNSTPQKPCLSDSRVESSRSNSTKDPSGLRVLPLVSSGNLGRGNVDSGVVLII